jgi:hypothetical protein
VRADFLFQAASSMMAAANARVWHGVMVSESRSGLGLGDDSDSLEVRR